MTFMMVMYALERRHRGFVLAFAVGCGLSSAYGFLAGTWPFGVVEAIWALIAVDRYRRLRRVQGEPVERPLRPTGSGDRDDVEDVARAPVLRSRRQAERVVVEQRADIER